MVAWGGRRGKLLRAATRATRIGEPQPLTAPSYGVRFVRKVRLEESAAVVWEFKRVEPFE